MKPTTQEIKKIERMVRKCMNLLKQKDYALDITKMDVDHAVALTRVVKKNLPVATYGGRDVVQINLFYFQHHDDNSDHVEYDAFKNDKVIGNTEVSGLDDHYLLTVAHEVSHHVQRRIMPRHSRYKGKHQKPHGEGFQRIYRWLRRDLVNPIIVENLKARGRRESRSDRFIRLAEARVNKLIKQIRLIGNLSNRNNYHHAPEDAAAICNALTVELNKLKARFKGGSELVDSHFKLS